MDADSHRALWEGIGGVVGWVAGCGRGNILAEATFRFSYVLGFEPSIPDFDYLATVSAVEGVKALNLAISDHDGTVELTLQEGIRLVPCRSLDSLSVSLSPPDFIYVRAPGHEIQILLGAEFLLVTSTPSWIFEMYQENSGRALMSFLNKYGYDCEVITDPDETYPSNHFWVKAILHQSTD